ncbi:MAG: MIP/aquaporin family protein [Chitinophagaceae bacterium]|nr:MIP/aquaporin family protein [Chitinophagaceae bacterium]
MSAILAEIIGTALLIILGDGVVANVLLNKTKGNNSGWIVITFGWAIAVFTGVFVSAQASGAHLNPAVSIGLAVQGGFEWDKVPGYIAAQFIGAIAGAIIVWLTYRQHFAATQDADAKLAVFCNAPAIRNTAHNLITEIIGTFVLLTGVLFMSKPEMKLGALDALPVALLVLGIGLSLGGPTGYAINPARDLGPRIAHFILPIPGKRDSDWGYSWIPVAGPVTGGILAALFYNAIH